MAEKKKTTGSKKKSTAKKTGKEMTTVKKDTSKKADSDEKKLRDALKEYAEDLDLESLAFLVQQAQVLRKRLKVQELSKEYEQLDVHAIAAKKAGVSKDKLEVKEADDNSHFIFVINGARNFFSLKEMREMVKLCHHAASTKDGARRLYAWFGRHREDVIKDTSIDGPLDTALLTMYNYIVNNYTVKE